MWTFDYACLLREATLVTAGFKYLWASICILFRAGYSRYCRLAKQPKELLPGYIIFELSSKAALKASTEGRIAKGLVLLQSFLPTHDDNCPASWQQWWWQFQTHIQKEAPFVRRSISHRSQICLFMTFYPSRKKSIILVELPKSIRAQILESHCLPLLPQAGLDRYVYVQTRKSCVFRVHMMRSSMEGGRITSFFHQMNNTSHKR